MNRQKIVFLALLTSFSFIGWAQTTNKKSLGEEEYNTWKEIAAPKLSDDGKWLWYGLNPQYGDGRLVIRTVDNSRTTEVDRGTNPLLFANGKYMLMKQKVAMDTLRSAKIAKLKDDMLPQDTFSVLQMDGFRLMQYPQAKEFKVSEEGTTAAYSYEVKTDTTDKAKKYNRLVIFDVVSGDSITADSVKSFAISRNGKTVMYSKVSDSICQVHVCPAPGFPNAKELSHLLYDSPLGKVPVIAVDEKGEQVAFIASQDTVRHALYSLHYVDLKWGKAPQQTKIDHLSPQMPKEWSVSPYSSLGFTQNGNQLKFAIAPKLKEVPKDTLPADETFSFDLWSWHDTYLMTQQLARKKSLEEKNYAAVCYPREKRWLPLADSIMETVQYAENDDAPYALAISDTEYKYSMMWDLQTPKDIYLIDLRNGSKRKVVEKRIVNQYLSPTANYLLFYDYTARNWFSIDTKTGKEHPVSSDISYPLYNEDNDIPQHPAPYSFVGWSVADGKAFISDRFDIWALDMQGKRSSENLTRIGRDTHTQFSLLSTNRKRGKGSLVDLSQTLLLRAFHRDNKESGFYTLDAGNDPVKRVGGKWTFTYKGDANEGSCFLFTRENYQEFRDLWIADKETVTGKRLTDANPQQAEYNWGTSQLFEWTDLNGRPAKGILYLPEDYDSSKPYPTIVYFYETHTNELYRYFQPVPSRSVISPTVCNNSGYVVFMPDITYTKGYPGKSCYDIVVSGAQALIERGIAIKDRIGLQGQSWGGYQISYLVTRTDMFRCCSPGAPVSNMLSAYGGIRWESGMSRSYQYEQSQSRIGASPWERLDLYLENSPVVKADRVNTPMLIRHSDNDGAVPWYQGIEYFIALRRLGKPVWLLNYNKEPHNLQSRPASLDWTKRMYQFFDYYLKDAPMPRWMKEGISVTEKGIDRKLELVNE